MRAALIEGDRGCRGEGRAARRRHLARSEGGRPSAEAVDHVHRLVLHQRARVRRLEMLPGPDQAQARRRLLAHAKLGRYLVEHAARAVTAAHAVERAMMARQPAVLDLEGRREPLEHYLLVHLAQGVESLDLRAVLHAEVLAVGGAHGIVWRAAAGQVHPLNATVGHRRRAEAQSL